MKKCTISILICIILLFQLAPVLSTDSFAATYTEEQWEALILRYQHSLFGGEGVDWEDPQIRAIVGSVNSVTGLSTSGISYQGGRYWLDFEANRLNRNRLFEDRDISVHTPSATMGNQFVFLYYMARAYATVGARYCYEDKNGVPVTLELYGNQKLRSDLFYGLQKSLVFYNYDSWYAQVNSSNNTVTYNWWDWAYQAPMQIGRILMALYPYTSEQEQRIAEELANTAIALVNEIRPNQHSDANTRMTYRRTRLNIIPPLAAVVRNKALMDETKNNLAYFLKNDYSMIDGVKRDGSYICHGSLAMEGRYGIDVLISRVIDTYSVLRGTAFAPVTKDAINQFYWIMDVFKPLMLDCGIMAQSNGREPQSAISMSANVIKGALQIIGCFGEKEDLQLKQFIRSVIIGETESYTRLAYSKYASTIGDLNLIQSLKSIIFDQTIASDTELYAVMRYETDRAVQHREDYTVGLAMSSNRISPYESINGCNRYGWFTGDGMVYVYNDRTTYNYDQYGEAYQRFANMYRVPGTTQEDAELRKPWSDRMSYSPGMTYRFDPATKKGYWTKDTNVRGQYVASFVGGVEMDSQYIAAAMDFKSYSWTEDESLAEVQFIHTTSTTDENAENNKKKQILVSDLTAKKSYFMFDDEIVCVGSDIDFSTRDTVVNTYVDNRELLEKRTTNGVTVYGNEDILVDGVLLEKVNAFSSPKRYTDPTWVHQENFGGYYFPQGGQVYVNKTFRYSTNDRDSKNDDYNPYFLGINPRTEQHSFFELWLSHGKKPQNETYSYVMLPEKSSKETEAYAKTPDVSILCANDSVHVIREHTLGITAMVFWQAGRYEDIIVSQPCIIMIREQGEKYRISVSDPTQENWTGYVTIDRCLTAVEADPEVKISGGEQTYLDLNFRKEPGKTLSAEFTVRSPNYLMFDFNTDTRERYASPLYGYYDYTLASNWAIANLQDASATIQGGAMTLPLTSGFHSSGDPIYTTNIEPSDDVNHFAWTTSGNYAAFLRFDPGEAQVFQIRLKLNDVSTYGPYPSGVNLYYLPKGASRWSNELTGEADPNPVWENLKINIPEECLKGGSLEGKYVTLSLSLERSKFISYDQINGVMFSFGNMRGGRVTIDHIYIGPKTDHLYFGFENGQASLRYGQGAYGGFSYDCEGGSAWATTCTDKVENYYTIDNEGGTLSLYAADDHYGTLGIDEHYGPYIETTAVSGTYPWTDQSLMPLSYDPSSAQILELRFRTEGLVQAENEKPCVMLLYSKQVLGDTSRNSDGSVRYTLREGEYQTLQMKLPAGFTEADFIESLGLRFRGVMTKDPLSVGKVEIDYIYVGPKAHAPSEGLYFSFDNDPVDKGRYQGVSYGGVNFDGQGWCVGENTMAPTYDPIQGTMSITMEQDNEGLVYAQTGVRGQRTLPLQLDPADAEYLQIRFRTENLEPFTSARMSFYYDTDGYAEKNGRKTMMLLGYKTLTTQQIQGGEYVTLTLQLPQGFRKEKRISCVGMALSGCTGKSAVELGCVTYDYIFIGRRNSLPTPLHSVTYYDPERQYLLQRDVLDGCPTAYVGQTPVKEPDEQCRYVFSAWVNEQGDVVDLSSVTSDLMLVSSFTAQAHEIQYTRINKDRHLVQCSVCNYEQSVEHSFVDGICLCGARRIGKPIRDKWRYSVIA
ncbi:MAG: hypothetical protein J6K89_00040 [Oscillospiraceae bacterium]|nr:hypothetical protein [Oscillospiraceae bacterium]